MYQRFPGPVQSLGEKQGNTNQVRMAELEDRVQELEAKVIQLAKREKAWEDRYWNLASDVEENKR